MITIRNYVRASSLEEAWQLYQKKSNRILGGMLWLRMGKGTVDTAIDLCDLGLSGITETDDSFTIGAMTSLREIEVHEGLSAYSGGAVAEALKGIVGVQMRNLATLGGSLFGRYGFSDVLTVFLAMDAFVDLYRGGLVPLKDFARAPHDRDLIKGLVLRKTPGIFLYRAFRLTKTDFPVLTTCFSRVSGKWRFVYGARPMRAMLLSDEKDLLGNGLSEEAIRAFALYAADTVPTGSNVRGSKEYRAHLVKVLTEHSLREMGGIE